MVRCSLLVAGLAVSASIAAQDRLAIENIADSDNVVVMLDARTKPGNKGCSTNETIFRSRGDTELGNLRSPAGCRSEIVILSTGNAMKLQERVAWTDKAGETRTVTLDPIIDVPVRVWITNGAGEATPRRDMDRANEIYKKNRVGVNFVPKYEDVSTDRGKVDAIKAGIDATQDGADLECKDIKSIRSNEAIHAKKTLNVYYVDLPFANAGRNCAIMKTPRSCTSTSADRKGDGNITYIGTGADRLTLAHELGHAFGLRPGPCGGHTTKLKPFTRNNVMWADPDDPNPDADHFTLGQVFRMNTQADKWGGTMLIANGLRRGPGRRCPPRSVSDACPPLAADWPRP